MEFPFPSTEIREGAARLLVPDVRRRKGPGAIGRWPFYNPTMAVNRDFAAMVLLKWPRRLGSVLDGLAATGAWGLRVHLEAGSLPVDFTDRSVLAAQLIRENLRRNGVKADVFHADLRNRLREFRYDYVDIDPFGSPVPFIGPLMETAEIGAGFGLTATDTAVLCGTYPQACLKRYGARPKRCPQAKEIGLRILLGFCAREAAKRGKSIRPVLSFAAEHFLRVYGIVEGRAAPPPLVRVERRAEGEWVPVRRTRSVVAEGLRRTLNPASGPGSFGPLWMGPLWDSGILARLTPSEWTSSASIRLLGILQGEADLPAFFVTTDELAERERAPQPKMQALIETLRDASYRAARTHLHPRGIRTDAPFEAVLAAFRGLVSTGSRDGSRPAS